MIVVLMGVSGGGKTTIGKLLAARTGWKFEDADDDHPRKTGGKWPPEAGPQVGPPQTQFDYGAGAAKLLSSIGTFRCIWSI
jgi:hypothetical protein